MLTIREASEGNVGLLVPLFHAMERHYEGDPAIAADLVRQRLGGFLNGGPTGLFLIAQDAAALGFATLFEVFPGGDLTRAWYMKDLYVAEAARGRGVGEALMRAAARGVLERGGTRIDFVTGGDNRGAQRFYDRLGASRDPNVFYRCDAQLLTRLAEG